MADRKSLSCTERGVINLVNSGIKLSKAVPPQAMTSCILFILLILSCQSFSVYPSLISPRTADICSNSLARSDSE